MHGRFGEDACTKIAKKPKNLFGLLLVPRRRQNESPPAVEAAYFIGDGGQRPRAEQDPRGKSGLGETIQDARS